MMELSGCEYASRPSTQEICRKRAKNTRIYDVTHCSPNVDPHRNDKDKLQRPAPSPSARNHSDEIPSHRQLDPAHAHTPPKHNTARLGYLGSNHRAGSRDAERHSRRRVGRPFSGAVAANATAFLTRCSA
ncbi:uncharacterized protein BP01DRAFT_133090 [Aspergillus saccharolyticus JOP 1030-1]|uniref:Uncharacterized protein n=1 Tax=Aspergillus saccharolyticus JOP 1030-1 TaxID=1450539 RepID=A0A319A4Z6_9EURO|nr:hypothetical protein BP01DRAFT_133090 [Aspergillus saccharolyticus JOP 1030-1]PYH42492.1 hypothetical protein BP01DRAFT_133090 [Aspergillus saccharolyticus JOP 1030-1]